MKHLYLESSIVSYLAALPSRDLIKTARQQITHEWWAKRRHDFEVFVSEIVIEEISQGNSDAVQRRLEVVAGLPVLNLTEAAEDLAGFIVDRGGLPAKAVQDALHLGVAAVHGVDYLLTWNCRYLANAELMGGMSALLVERGFHPPVVCTPDELLGQNDV
ncbi:MAG TPA: type II toxin-antitoxin system VapC family toxin [Candidatus Hydrogenedentes bacterium]|nr:type II toxin-antitoxin system VapC family toxin [Candidatus Hydrogenedentota bacterium]HRT21987.1 type II toxin-antitoxin system VapC family toxin [Candidatus Hydrogenedentota bacterium]HRT65313.1 type II toxin-antitoxin system VapC family toxin [Candidatus Hydrogenedentota bacterium]